LSQRNCPALASIATALEPADAPTQLVLTAPGADRPLIVPLQRGKASGGSTAGGSGPPIPSAAVASSSSSFGGKPGGMPQRADSWGWWDSAGGTTDSQLDLAKLDVEPGSVVGFKAREGRGLLTSSGSSISPYIEDPPTLFLLESRLLGRGVRRREHDERGRLALGPA
jgi:hypothetical protein